MVLRNLFPLVLCTRLLLGKIYILHSSRYLFSVPLVYFIHQLHHFPPSFHLRRHLWLKYYLPLFLHYSGASYYLKVVKLYLKHTFYQAYHWKMDLFWLRYMALHITQLLQHWRQFGINLPMIFLYPIISIHLNLDKLLTQSPNSSHLTSVILIQLNHQYDNFHY